MEQGNHLTGIAEMTKKEQAPCPITTTVDTFRWIEEFSEFSAEHFFGVKTKFIVDHTDNQTNNSLCINMAPEDPSNTIPYTNVFLFCIFEFYR